MKLSLPMGSVLFADHVPTHDELLVACVAFLVVGVVVHVRDSGPAPTPASSVRDAALLAARQDIVVLTGTAEILDDFPAVHGNPAWLEKYGEAIDARVGSAAKFAEKVSIPVRIHLTRVRGF